MVMLDYAWLIPLVPLLAFLGIAGVTRPWRRVSGYVAVAGATIALALALAVDRAVLAGARFEASFDWLPLASAGAAATPALRLGILIDPLTAVMLLVVTAIGLMVVVYSQGYLHGDPGYSRYFAFISLFCAAMLGLVLANSLLTLYVCWELVGLCSYLLIGFWYQKPEAAAAAKKAFLVTRLGDFGLLAGILLLYAGAGTLEFTKLGELIAGGRLDASFLSLVGVLIFCGAAGKSAQFPLHVWLPDAMEGPTPVSALIHAATMVAAGIYLVARTYPIFAGGPVALLVVMVVGTFTALFAATLALVATDIKRVMAYSTISQLGYMMLALGVGAPVAATFHLMNHAFFKALLFLTAGSVIHALGSQDLRLMGGLLPRMKVTAITMLVGALSLAGFPFLTSGFWSKDEILSAAYDHGQYVVFAVGLLTAFLTAFYMFRAWFLAFWGKPRWSEAAPGDGGHVSSGHGAAGLPGHGLAGPVESPWVMRLPLIVLAVPSLLSGFWGSPLFGNGFALFLEGHPSETGANWLVMSLSSAVALGGIGLAWALYGARSLDPAWFAARLGPVRRVLENRYWIDEAYGWTVNVVVLGVGRALRRFDAVVVDGAVNGVGALAVGAGRDLRRIQTGRLQDYAWAMYAGALLIAVAFLVAGRLAAGQ